MARRKGYQPHLSKPCIEYLFQLQRKYSLEGATREFKNLVHEELAYSMDAIDGNYSGPIEMRAEYAKYVDPLGRQSR